MKFIVQDLLKLDAYKDAVLLGGHYGVTNEVHGITIIEDVTIGEWLRGNEALITSLVPFKEYSEEALAEFFSSLLAVSNISALIIKVGKAFSEVPHALINWGNINNVPIIKVPRSNFYTDLMYPVLAEILNSQVRKLEYFKKVHDQFNEMALNNYSVSDILENLRELIKNPMVFMDKSFNVIYKTLNTPTNMDINRVTLKALSKHGKSSFQSKIQLAGKWFTIKVFLVVGFMNTKSYLAVIEKNKEVEEMDTIAIETVCTNISHKMTIDFIVHEVEKNFMSDVISDLFFGTLKDNKYLLERANIAGIDLKSPHVVVALSFDDKLLKEHETMKKIVSSIIEKLDGVYRMKNDKAIILLTYSEADDAKKVLKEIKHTLADFKKHYSWNKSEGCFAAGIGSMATSYEDISKSYNEAVEAVELGVSIYGKNAIILFEELGFFKLLRDFPNKSSLSAYIPASLNTLINYDNNKKSNLVGTLESYLRNNQHIKQTANELFVHPKTVSYRLEQIKDISKINFKDSEEIIELQIAFKILKFISFN